MAEKTSVACIALSGRNVLIAHRLPVGQMGGRWEFPGGKVEEGETAEEAAVREMREEFGVTVTVGERIAVSSFVHDGTGVSLECYRIFVPHDGGPGHPYALTEHSEYAWADIGSISSLCFVDSDLLLYPEVRRYVEENAR